MSSSESAEPTALATARARAASHPRDPRSHNELGMVLGDQRRFGEATDCFRRALAIERDFPQALHNLGMALMELGQADEAEKSYRQLLALLPQVGVFHADHGDALLALARFTEAEQSYRRALRLDPSLALAHLGLAKALRRQGRLTEAEQAYRDALLHMPRDTATHIQLGATLFDLGRIAESEQSFTQAIALDPDLPLVHAAFAYLLIGSGRLLEAEASCRRALSLDPALTAAHSSLAFVLNFIPGRGADEISAAHQAFGRCFRDAGSIPPHGNSPDPERRLRIGYVSADLRHHSVSFFIAPLLANHDKSAFEVFCYYNYAAHDAITQRLKSHADHWRDVFALQDEALAELIRRDQIDVLIDLAGHTTNNRLRSLARKPAPVQATWLGYLNTTGLDAMDWRITDARATPEGPLDRLHSERLWRLPDSQWCYEPPATCPPVSTPPSASSGTSTFAAFSTLTKLNDQVIGAWSRLLHAVPGARLMVVANGLATIPPGCRERFTQLGIDEQRLQIVTTRPFDEYIALHDSVDIVLDTFPCAGGTTTCHALWMGVPVVSLAGSTATSRGGASLLHAVGLPELVAESEDHYVAIAAGLAGDAPRLASLRAGMRDRMRASPLMDPLRFARNFESACRTMWREWCASGGRA